MSYPDPNDYAEASAALIMCADLVQYSLPFLMKARRAALESALEAETQGENDRLRSLSIEAISELNGVCDLMLALSGKLSPLAETITGKAEQAARDETGATQH